MVVYYSYSVIPSYPFLAIDTLEFVTHIGRVENTHSCVDNTLVTGSEMLGVKCSE